MAWYNTSWTKRRKITVDNTQVSATLTDFPVYVQFANDSEFLASARDDGYDVLFTSSDGSTKLSHDVAWQGRLNRDGIGTWFGCSRSLYANGYTYITFVSAAGDMMIGQYNHSTGAWSEFELDTAFNTDDHATPSVTRMGNGKLLVVYAAHNGSSLFYRISTSADDISAWDTRAAIDTGDTFNYPAALVLSGESNKVYVFYSKGITTARVLTYKTSTDNGATWSSATSVFGNTGERPYWHCYPEGGDTIHFVISDGHPTEVASNSMYHFYYNGSAWYTSDGTDITASLPLAPADVTKVYDSATSGYPAWSWDIRVDSSGYPVFVYVEFRTLQTDHRARYARWNGSAWADNEVASMGYSLSPEQSDTYAGGVAIDDADADVVYVSEIRNNRRVIAQYTTADGGATWDSGTVISQTSNMMNIRPTTPWGAQSGLKVHWWNGHYRFWDNEYDTGIQTYPSIVKAVDAQYLVKVPSLNGSADTDIYCYYGNASATDQSDAANAKDADTVLQALGSLAQLPLGTPNLAGYTTLTVESWFRPYSDPNDDAHIVSNWTAGTAAFIFRVAFADAGNPMEGIVLTTGGNVGRTFTDVTPTVDATNYAALLYDNADGGLKMYLNGTLSSQAQASTNAMHGTASVNVLAGRSPHLDTGDEFPGDVRIVAISDVRRSSDYLGTRWNNLNAPGTFYSDDTSPDPAPTITNVSPATVAVGATVDLTVTGTGFIDGIAASSTDAGFTVNSETWVSDTEVTVNVTGVTAGTYTNDLVLTNPDQQTATGTVRVLASTTYDGTDNFVRAGAWYPLKLRSGGTFRFRG